MTAVAVAVNPPSTVDRLVRDNARLVTFIARQHHSPLGLEELIAAGNLGLVIAAQKWTSDHKHSFCTFAGYWIRAYIRLAIQNDSGVNKTQNARKLFWGIKKAANEVGEDTAAIASHLGVRVKEVNIFGPHLLRGLIRLDASYKGADGCIGERLLVDETTPEALTIEHLDSARHLRKLRTAIALLRPIERRIIIHRFLDEPRMTLEQIGCDLGMTREGVRQIEIKVLEKLRKALA